MCPLFLDYKFALSNVASEIIMPHFFVQLCTAVLLPIFVLKFCCQFLLSDFVPYNLFAKLKGMEVRNLLDNLTIVLLEAYFNELLYQSGDYCKTNIDRNKYGSHPHSYELYLSSSENKA